MLACLTAGPGAIVARLRPHNTPRMALPEKAPSFGVGTRMYVCYVGEFLIAFCRFCWSSNVNSYDRRLLCYGTYGITCCLQWLLNVICCKCSIPFGETERVHVVLRGVWQCLWQTRSCEHCIRNAMWSTYMIILIEPTDLIRGVYEESIHTGRTAALPRIEVLQSSSPAHRKSARVALNSLHSLANRLAMIFTCKVCRL